MKDDQDDLMEMDRRHSDVVQSYVQQAMMMTVDRDNWRRFVVANPYGPC